MEGILPNVHFKCTCDHCGEVNEITAINVHDTELVTCSACGNPLGTLGEIAKPGRARKPQRKAASMSLDAVPRGIGRKSPSRDYTLKRAAVAAVSPLGAKLGHFQMRSVHLLALGEKLHTSGQHDPRYVEEAESLMKDATHERHEFDARIARLPDTVKSQSYVRDTDRALSAVLVRLSAARALL